VASQSRPEQRDESDSAEIPSASTDEAWQALAVVHNWFTEGFDTPDLQEASALLAKLS